MTEAVKLLSDEEVSRFLALSKQNTGPSFGYTHDLCKAVDALCATVHALRAKTALILTEQEVGILADYHYREAEKAITRRGSRAGQRYHLERLAIMQAITKVEQEP